MSWTWRAGTLLRHDALIADTGFVHQPGVEGDMPGQSGKPRCGPVIGPGRTQGGLAPGDHVEIARYALPFAKARPRGRAKGGLHVIGWQVVGRGMVGFQHPQGAACLGHGGRRPGQP